MTFAHDPSYAISGQNNVRSQPSIVSQLRVGWTAGGVNLVACESVLDGQERRAYWMRKAPGI